jgi:hypothetical protein
VVGDIAVRLTEGGLLPYTSRAKEEGWGEGVAPAPVWDPANHDLIVQSLRHDLKDAKLGIPRDDRILLRNLRRAIQAAWRPKAGGYTDGGASLLPVYLDVIQSQFAAGHMTPEFVRRYVQRWVVREPGKAPRVVEVGTQEASDFATAVPFFLRFLDQWPR